jgi:hypothetical protein
MQADAEWKQGDHGNTQTAGAIAKQKGQGKRKYLAVTLSMFCRVAAVTLFALRSLFPNGLLKAARTVTDSARSSLILLGGPKTGTGLHVDWTEAFNIAFSVGDAPTMAVLAVWVFLHPAVAQAAHDWLKQNGWQDGLAAKVRLEGASQEQFTQHLEQKQPGSVLVIEQRAGEMIRVVPGWIHQVSNLQPSLKLAFEVYDVNHFHAYGLLMHRIASPLFGKAMPRDYMGVNGVAEEMFKCL